MSGLTMGYTNGFYTASSGKKIGEFIEKPLPTAGNIVYALTASAEFTRHGRRPYKVSVLNDRGEDIFFLFDETTPTEWTNFGDNPDDDSTKEFEMSPIAWSGSHADSAAGDVIFHFRGDM